LQIWIKKSYFVANIFYHTKRFNMKQFIFSLLALFVLLAYSPPCLAFESNHERQKTEFCAQIEIIYPVTIFVGDVAENPPDVCFAEKADNQTETQDLSKYFASCERNKDNLRFNWCDFIGCSYFNCQMSITENNTKVCRNHRAEIHHRKISPNISWCRSFKIRA